MSNILIVDKCLWVAMTTIKMLLDNQIFIIFRLGTFCSIAYNSVSLAKDNLI